MEKKIWSKPEMNEFAFAANEYVASACGDQNKTFSFECNAGGSWFFGSLYYYLDMIVNPNSTSATTAPSIEEFNKHTATELGGYDNCGKTHQAEATDGFHWGFVDRFNDGKHNMDWETVIVWTETDENGKVNNWHATKNLDVTQWEAQKS